MPLLRVVLLSLPLALTMRAGVTCDQTVRTRVLDGSVLLQSRVPAIDPPVFDIPRNLYAPPFDRSPNESFKIHLEGDRLVRIGKHASTIYDLKARSVTVVQAKGHTYSVETFDGAQHRLGALLKDWRPPLGTNGKYTIEVQKTGETRRIQDQTAEEYRIIAITLYEGQRLVAGSSIYWMVAKPPSDELAAFRVKWSRECGLPFPGMPATGGNPSVFGAMASAASKLTGYPILFVVESRPLPFPGLGRITGSPADYVAARNSLPEIPVDYWDRFSLRIDVTETAFSGFVAGAVDPSVFAVPAGYKKKNGRRYMLD